MYNVRAAAGRARRWLTRGSPSEPRDPLTELGLALCARIHRPRSGAAIENPSQAIILPAPSALVEMNREDILALTQAVTLSGRAAFAPQLRDGDAWARILGGIALSHGRDGDLVVVAALLRMGACLGLDGPWLAAALHHVLDQQQPDGSFGLLAPELALSDAPECEPQITLRLTVEVLWALAEVTAARARLCQASSIIA